MPRYSNPSEPMITPTTPCRNVVFRKKKFKNLKICDLVPRNNPSDALGSIWRGPRHANLRFRRYVISVRERVWGVRARAQKGKSGLPAHTNTPKYDFVLVGRTPQIDLLIDPIAGNFAKSRDFEPKSWLLDRSAQFCSWTNQNLKNMGFGSTVTPLDMLLARYLLRSKTRICIYQYLVQRVNHLYKGRRKSGILTDEE